jgi:hypothetical protein
MYQTYIVINENDITESILKESTNTADMYRLCLDRTLAVLKFAERHPDCCVGLKKYTHDEILAYLETNSADWTEAEL